jgi:hypothetical protein
MIRSEQISDEVIEAAKEAYRHTDEKTMSDWLAEIIAAAVNAWPGAEVHNFDGWTHAEGLVLPLPQQDSDE